MKTTLKVFAPAPEATPAREVLEAHAQGLWQGLPFGWKPELELWLHHAESHGGKEYITLEGLKLWMTRVQAALCPIAGAGCKPPIPISRFCRFHFEKLSQ